MVRYSSVTIVVLGLMAAISSYFLFENWRNFPVDLVTCDDITKNCQTTAKYGDLQSCQWAAEHGNMRCQWSTDKRQATCEAALDAFALGHCVTR